MQDIYVPPECPEGGLCPPAKQPHFWITDSETEQGKKRALMIVSYAYQIPEWEMDKWKDVPQVVIQKGQQVKLKGVFKRFSNTGFAHDNGLVDFVSYMGTDAESGAAVEIWPPGSPVHPQTLALDLLRYPGIDIAKCLLIDRLEVLASCLGGYPFQRRLIKLCVLRPAEHVMA